MKLSACKTHRFILPILLALPLTATTILAQTTTPQAATKTAGYPVMVRVQLNGSSITGAHITATTADGTAAGSGDTDSSGVVRLTLDPGDYIFTGTSGDKTGTAKAHVESSLTMVILELAPTTASPQ